MLRSPRTKFVESAHAAAWKKLVQSEVFEESTNAAMLELQLHMPGEWGDQQTSSDAHQQTIGARKYLDLLYEICDKEPQPKIAQSKGLNYGAGV